MSPEWRIRMEAEERENRNRTFPYVTVRITAENIAEFENDYVGRKPRIGDDIRVRVPRPQVADSQ